MKNVERVEILTQLGLTFNQARAYLALSLFGPSGAKNLAITSKITRQDVYRVMLSLEETGIIEKVLGKPATYKAVPIRQAAQILLERKDAEHKELQAKTHKLIHSLESFKAEIGKQNIENQFVMIPGKEAILHKLGEALKNTKRSLDMVTSGERFSSILLELRDRYEEALDRGVRIRIATQKSSLPKPVADAVHKLCKSSGFELRFFTVPPEAAISIFDETEASVTVNGVTNISKATALWSNEASFVALARNYFLGRWNESTKPERTK